MITLLLAAAAAGLGFWQARSFVGRRLRYVDAVQKPFFPIAAGLAVALVTLPLGILPFITGFTSIAAGVGVGAGFASGAKDVRHRRLTG